ncbi:pyridoxamine 5'-phosphate oxidase family protein [Halomarina ordinaria]|uniref:Pyridoxamine 5'-phosphate oxidase family protein n=1 Tax=Halomarina ordinaria TaxID=3033939 RepID=A0ABD5UC89_9EURY|nr:pyridoxamine 5'-phosphate oxidase family protein [Halomarina sp. PSRA2]
MEHIEFVYTMGMDEADVERRLRDAEAGVLSLADGDDAYAVPVSHHYEDGSVFFRLSDDAHSEKLAFVETTRRACFVVYGVEGADESWSVVATGTLRPVEGAAAERFDAAGINDRFGPLRVFDEAIDEVDVVVLELDVEEVTGRRTT